MQNVDLVYIVLTVFISLGVGALLMWIHRSITDNIKEEITEELKSDKAFYTQMLKRWLAIEETEEPVEVDYEDCPVKEYQPSPPVKTQSDLKGIHGKNAAKFRVSTADKYAIRAGWEKVVGVDLNKMASYTQKCAQTDKKWRINLYPTTGTIVVNLTGYAPYTAKDILPDNYPAVFESPNNLFNDKMVETVTKKKEKIPVLPSQS